MMTDRSHRLGNSSRKGTRASISILLQSTVRHSSSRSSPLTRLDATSRGVGRARPDGAHGARDPRDPRRSGCAQEHPAGSSARPNPSRACRRARRAALARTPPRAAPLRARPERRSRGTCSPGSCNRKHRARPAHQAHRGWTRSRQRVALRHRTADESSCSPRCRGSPKSRRSSTVRSHLVMPRHSIGFGLGKDSGQSSRAVAGTRGGQRPLASAARGPDL